MLIPGPLSSCRLLAAFHPEEAARPLAGLAHRAFDRESARRRKGTVVRVRCQAPVSFREAFGDLICLTLFYSAKTELNGKTSRNVASDGTRAGSRRVIRIFRKGEGAIERKVETREDVGETQLRNGEIIQTGGMTEKPRANPG